METTYEFTGIKQLSEYLYASVHVRIGSETDSIGYVNIKIEVPVANREQSLSALREESLALARACIQEAPLLQWANRQRADQSAVG
jgi:hypothetical protein